MDSAIETFCGLLGQTLLLRHPGRGEIEEVAFVEEPATGHRIELIARPTGPPGQLDHIAFEVDDVDAEYGSLVTHGLQPVTPPIDVPTGAFFLEKIHSRSCRLANLMAPNGLLIQLVRYD